MLFPVMSVLWGRLPTHVGEALGIQLIGSLASSASLVCDGATQVSDMNILHLQKGAYYLDRFLLQRGGSYLDRCWVQRGGSYLD